MGNWFATFLNNLQFSDTKPYVPPKKCPPPPHTPSMMTDKTTFRHKKVPPIYVSEQSLTARHKKVAIRIGNPPLLLIMYPVRCYAAVLRLLRQQRAHITPPCPSVVTNICTYASWTEDERYINAQRPRKPRHLVA